MCTSPKSETSQQDLSLNQSHPHQESGREESDEPSRTCASEAMLGLFECNCSNCNCGLSAQIRSMRDIHFLFMPDSQGTSCGRSLPNPLQQLKACMDDVND